MSPDTPLPPTLTTHVALSFAAIARGLFGLIWQGCQRHVAFFPIFIPICSFITKRIHRFERALTTPPRPRKPCPSRAGRAPDGRIRVALPRSHAWFIKMLGNRANAYAHYLEQLLAEPGVPELIAANPSAARILRPLCHLLGIKPPCIQRAPAPRRPRKPKTPRPPKPPKPAPFPNAHLRHPSSKWPKGVLLKF